jgi:hypothetical protein
MPGVLLEQHPKQLLRPLRGPQLHQRLLRGDDPRQTGQQAEMLVLGVLGAEQQEEQVDRLSVQGVEIQPFAAPPHHQSGPLETVHDGVG